MKLPPASRKRAMISLEPSSSSSRPNVMHPRHNSETINPVLPKRLYSTGPSLLGDTRNTRATLAPLGMQWTSAVGIMLTVAEAVSRLGKRVDKEGMRFHRREQGHLQALRRGGQQPRELRPCGRDLRYLPRPPARWVGARAWPRGRQTVSGRVPRSLPQLPRYHRGPDRRGRQGDDSLENTWHPPGRV